MIPNIETSEEYEQASAYKDALYLELIKPRCALCESNRKGYCVKFAQDVPSEFLYKKTDCKEFNHNVPF